MRAPADITPRRVRYTDATIMVERLTSRAAARRLRAGIVSPKSAIGSQLEFARPGGESFAGWVTTEDDTAALHQNEWPELVVHLSGDARAPLPCEPLQTPGQPLYSTWAAAIGDLVFERAIEPARLHQQAIGIVRLSDQRGRLGALRVTPETVAVDVGAKSGSIRGWTLRATWRTAHADPRWESTDIAIREPSEVTVEVGAVPYEMTIALVDERGRLVDRRGWDAGAARPLGEAASLEARIEHWRQFGESQEIEFKQALDERATRERLAESVAAFANGSGGVVLVGIDDYGEIVGYGLPNAADQISQIISNSVTDPPHVEIDRADLDGRPVWVIRVAPSPPDARPHTVRDRVLVRAHATNRAATPREIRQMTAAASDLSTLPFPTRRH
jgi:hypothetical protein